LTSSFSWTYLTEGSIAQVTPSQGQGGTRVRVEGSRARGGGASVASATLAGVAATLVNETDTVVELLAGSGPASQVQGHVVLTADTGALVTQENGWTYLAAGVIESVTPSSGQAGTRVTLSGQRLLGGGSSVFRVTLQRRGGQPGDGHGHGGGGDGGQQRAGSQHHGADCVGHGSLVQRAAAFTYAAPGEITLVQPDSGQGGTLVTITGTGLRASGAAVASVTLGGVAAAIEAQNNTRVVVRAGVRPGGRQRGRAADGRARAPPCCWPAAFCTRRLASSAWWRRHQARPERA
jgi:hypothetical protein